MVTQTPGASETELHALLHSQLDLTAQQEARIERIEADFTGRRHALEKEMRAANVRLAQAIEAEHGDGPRVTEAIDHSQNRQRPLSGKSVSSRLDLAGRT